MNPFEMVVLIVAIVMIAGVVRARHHQALADSPEERAETQRLKDEVTQLKARIAVLERIATDANSSLEREIEQLRDGQA